MNNDNDGYRPWSEDYSSTDDDATWDIDIEAAGEAQAALEAARAAYDPDAPLDPKADPMNP